MAIELESLAVNPLLAGMHLYRIISTNWQSTRMSDETANRDERPKA
jgi:hypothetical protein